MHLVKQSKSLKNKLMGDEDLLRLLFYRASHPKDDVLDNARPDVLDMTQSLNSGVPNSQSERTANIVTDRIKMTRKIDDLTDENPKCRVCVYLGDMEKTTNHLHAKQYILVDVICHEVFENTDLRSQLIIQRVNSLLFGERTGFGKNNFEGMSLLENLVEGANYIAYQLKYSTGTQI